VRTIALLSILTFSALLAPAARAEGLDATKSLRCALADAAECDEAAQ